MEQRSHTGYIIDNRSFGGKVFNFMLHALSFPRRGSILDFASTGRSAMYTAVATITDNTALMLVAAMLIESVTSAAGFPKITSL